MKTFVFILLFLPFTLAGQRNVSGKITDAENNEPVAGASVFISNTTIGANTNAEGYYQLQIPEGGSYQLTISYMGYQSVFKDIEPGNTSVKFDAALYTNVNELKELTVTAKARFRQSDIDLFWKTILGENPSPKTIQVKNPEAVYYDYNPETRMLKVTCREPLQLVNYETGYQIQYVLGNFTHNYNKNITDWNNQFIFTEIKPENFKQKNKWEKKRQEVYNVSLTKFIKSLYNNSLYNDGFVLANLRQSLDPNNPYQISLLKPEDVLSASSTDNSKYLNLSGGQVMLICYGRPVTDYDLYVIQNPQSKGFFKNSGLLMNLLLGESIRIFPDGTYTNRLLMTPVNLSNTLLALNTKLPIEYLPEELAPSDMEGGSAFDYDSIVQHFDTQTEIFPQEKIHLHTDRNLYVPGEKIWFKAYVTDAATLQPSTNSRYVYAELIDSRDSLIDRVMIRPDSDNMFYGHLFLSKIIPEGNYTLRAYTRYMENLGDDYFFKKNIRIGSLASNSIITSEMLNSGIDASNYLPQSGPRAYALTVSLRNNMLTVGVQKPAKSKDIHCYLLGQCRGQVFHFALLDKDSDSIDFPEEDLPAGVLQFVLLDKQMSPISERLAFSKNYNKAKVEFHTDKAVYNKREKVTATLSLTDSAGNSLTGNLSVSVTDDKDIAVDSTTTILSTLLLSSELKGYIENPAYYLQDNTKSVTALDSLMLTHGWNRYNIPEIAKGNYESPKIQFQTSQEISGKVKGKPLSGNEVLAMTKYGVLDSVSTGKNGAFMFQNFEYPDSTAYLVQALGKNGSSNIELVLDDESFPKPVHAPQSPINLISKEESSAFLEKAKQRSKYDKDMQAVQLSEVVAAGRKVAKKDELRLKFWANNGSDVTIRREDVEKSHPRLVTDWLRTVPGVVVSSNGAVSIRESMSINSGTAPLVIINGIESGEADGTPNSPLESVSVDDVESIDVFKGPSSSVFGVRGANGVISITTKNGINDVRKGKSAGEGKALNQAIYIPLGYQTPVEFFSPKYENLDAKNSITPDYRTTIFWKPDIVVSDGKEASFDFYTSDFPTTYSVVIEGLTNDGKIVRQVEKIRVE